MYSPNCIRGPRCTKWGGVADTMIKAAIFDLDGLLADTEELQFRAVRHALASESIPLDIETYQERWIRNGESLVDYLADYQSEFDPEHFRELKRTYYHAEIPENLQPMPGANELLAALHGKLQIGLATSSVAESVDLVLETLDFGKYLDTVVTKLDVARLKPHPDCFLLAAERLGVAPSECVVLEDAEKGVIAAQRAGMKCIAAPNGFTMNNDFSRATLTVDSLAELSYQSLLSL